MTDQPTFTSKERTIPPRRIALVVLGVVFAIAAVAPLLLLDTAPIDGRSGLARYQAITAGELSVSDEHVEALEDRFDQITLPDGTQALTSADEQGCWQLTRTATGGWSGPSPTDTDRCS